MSDQSGPEREHMLYRTGQLAGEPAREYPAAYHLWEADTAMLERWRAHRTGLAPYYPLLYSLVIGMRAQRVFEFGMGESTMTLLDALAQTGGILVSCSPEVYLGLGEHKYDHPNFIPLVMTSEEAVKRLDPGVAFDLVLHDGSHSADVVEADLLRIVPRMREGGLILVHDILHSYVGEAMRRGLGKGFDNGASHHNLDILSITLPFAFGLEVAQVFGTGHGPVSIGQEKASSPHHTERLA